MASKSTFYAVTIGFLLLVTAFPSTIAAAGQHDAFAPQFSAKAIDGKMVSSRQLLGRPYVVNFFASWCPFCRNEIPDLVALQDKYAKEGFTFIGIAFMDNEHGMEAFMWETGINYPVIMGDEALIALFGWCMPGGLKTVPTAFVIGRDGQLLHVVSGIQSRETLEALVRMAVESKP